MVFSFHRSLTDAIFERLFPAELSFVMDRRREPGEEMCERCTVLVTLKSAKHSELTSSKVRSVLYSEVGHLWFIMVSFKM